MIVKKILICEDHNIIVDGLKSLLSDISSYSVVGNVEDGENVMSAVAELKPDIVLLDLNLPNKNGLEILPEIKQLFPKINVIILTMYNTMSIVEKAKKLKADGFLLKNSTLDELLNALEACYGSTEFYLGEGVLQPRQNPFDNKDFGKVIQITPREKDIIREIVKGLSVPDIANKLHISPYTVETHKKNIYKKLSIKNNVDLVNFANENQLFA